MGRYPRGVRNAGVKCISCNAPAAATIDGQYVCVECGNTPVQGSSTGNTLPFTQVIHSDQHREESDMDP